jgi:multiple sugar transport system substrate-binding protein
MVEVPSAMTLEQRRPNVFVPKTTTKGREMKMRWLGAVAAASALVLSGCASGTGDTTADGNGTEEVRTDAEGPKALLVWVDAVREPACLQYKDLMAGEVDIACEVVGQDEILSKIQLGLQTGQGLPDVTFDQPNNVAIYQDSASGFAMNLSNYLDDQVFADYNTSNDWCLIDGSYYCLKNDLAQTVLWYDTVIFDELGLAVPTTMDEFASTALSLAGTGYIAGAIGDQGFYAGYLWPSGCPMVNVTDPATVQINADSPNCSRVWELTQPLVDAGVLDTRSSFDAGFLADVAQQQKVAMHIGPSWWGEFVIRPVDSWAVPEGRITAAPMPTWSGETTNWSGEWGGGIWVASSKSDFPEAAAAAVKYLATDPELMGDGVTFPGSRPAFEAWTQRLSTDAYYASDPTVAMVEQAGKIRQDNKPVRYDMQGQFGLLNGGINGGDTLENSVRAYIGALRNIAPAAGYTVVE